MRTGTGTRQREWRQRKATAEGRTLRLRSGRPKGSGRKYASNAARQAAYRQRKVEARELDAIFGAASNRRSLPIRGEP